jgi:cytochrome P450
VTALAQLLFEQAGPMEPAPRVRAFQAEGPAHKLRTATGDQAWLVTGYEEVRRLLAGPRLGRSHPDPATAARTGESVLSGGPLGGYETEEADHARMRSLLQPHFTPRRMRALRPRVDALTTSLLDELDRQDRPADLVEALAAPLPILVICDVQVGAGDLVLLDNGAANTTRRPSPIPTGSTSPASPPRTSPSATARATASARRWPASNCKPSSPSSFRGSRACAWPCPPKSSRSTPACSPVA